MFPTTYVPDTPVLMTGSGLKVSARSFSRRRLSSFCGAMSRVPMPVAWSAVFAEMLWASVDVV